MMVFRRWRRCSVWSFMLLLVVICQIDSVNGQRAAINLGSKLQTNGVSKDKPKHRQPSESKSFAGTQTMVQNDWLDTDKGVELYFDSIRMELKAKSKKKPARLLLDGSIRGKAAPGRMLAIMGPSGSGKTTLLDALAGKIRYSSSIRLNGRRFVNQHLLSGGSMLPAAYIEQDSNFFPHMTVQETLSFRVELKMGSMLRKPDKDKLVDDLMEQLNLSKSANTVVGNNKVRGISGGERKRLSIACEMISSPSVIFLDEPTSGLDSYQAMQVVETLRSLADSGKTIIAVIHQPSQQAFSEFDDLLLLSEGRQMYFGPVDSVRSYFAKLGYPAYSAETGTAEHVLDCISRVRGDDTIEAESEKRLDVIAKDARDKAMSVVGPETASSSSTTTKTLVQAQGRPRANIFRQFQLLMTRSLKELFRGKTAFIIKMVQQVSLGLIYGGIYSLNQSQSSIQDRVGLLSLIAIGAANMGMAGTIRSFPKEKAIVSNEIGSSLYQTLPYFLAKAIAEIPMIGVLNTVFGSIVYQLANLQRGRFRTFLSLASLHSIAAEAVGLLIGSISPSSDVALALFPSIVILNIIFDGKNIADENIPYVLRWIPKVGLIRWCFEGMMLNEFEGLKFDVPQGSRSRGPVALTGHDALARYGLADRKVQHAFQAQLAIIGGCWFLSFLGLSLTGQKYVAMELPVKSNESMEEKKKKSE